jgi:hypothetical protein
MESLERQILNHIDPFPRSGNGFDQQNILYGPADWNCRFQTTLRLGLGQGQCLVYAATARGRWLPRNFRLSRISWNRPMPDLALSLPVHAVCCHGRITRSVTSSGTAIRASTSGHRSSGGLAVRSGGSLIASRLVVRPT